MPSADVSIDQQIQKGASGARADDTKGMKGPIINWITPKGQLLTPHIPRNVKAGRGFNHDHTGALLCPAGLDWNNIVRYWMLTWQTHKTLIRLLVFDI